VSPCMHAAHGGAAVMRSGLAAIVLLSCALIAQADSWRAPRSLGKASADGSYAVRITPGSGMDDVIGHAGAPKGPFAVAEWYRYEGKGYTQIHTATLLNPIAPVQIEVTESGNLITLDNWHNSGMGVVLAIYTPDGTVVKQYTLQDLYSERELKRIHTTVSSVRWLCQGFPAILDTPRELWIEDSLGGRFRVNVETGSYVYHRNSGSCGR
jgi:hypothetical protein